MTPLVLLHGVGLDRHMWHDFTTALKRPAVTYDLLGLGDAPRPAGRYTLAMYSDQLDGVVASLGGPVDLVGFSMGALVAQRFAIDRPRLVRRLVVVSGVFDRTPAERAAITARVADVRAGGYAATVEPAIERWFTSRFRDAQPDVVERIRARMLANDVASYADAYEVFATGDAEIAPLVKSITAECLVVTGEADERSTPDMARRLAAALPHGRAVVVPGVRHMLPVEQPRELAAIVGDFLTRPDIGENRGTIGASHG